MKNIFDTGELDENSVIRKFWITANDGKKYLKNPGKISSEVAVNLANSKFDKYRVIQDENYESDFDKAVKRIIKKKRN